MEIIIQRILFLFDVKKITSADVAKATGISNAQISRILSGKSIPRITVLQKIAEALGTTVSFLVGESDLPERKFDEEFIYLLGERYKSTIVKVIDEEVTNLCQKSSVEIIKSGRICRNEKNTDENG
jgi:transcriptional regulator with XRE-family HTH domain